MLMNIPLDTVAAATAAGVDVDAAEHFLAGRLGLITERVEAHVAEWLADADLSEPATLPEEGNIAPPAHIDHGEAQPGPAPQL